jgi:hypothetical protein
MVSPPKKAKKKFKNAEAAKQHRQLEAEWVKLNDKWQPLPVKATSGAYAPEKDVPTRETGNKNVKSLDVWVTGTLSKKESPVYSGSAMKGVGTLHKSNGIPVFSDEEIIDLARMRR